VAPTGRPVLPFTTRTDVVLWSPAGLSGFDWFWLFLAVLIDLGDLGNLGGSRYASRNRMPGSAGQTATY
jgi:hypothetical protein